MRKTLLRVGLVLLFMAVFIWSPKIYAQYTSPHYQVNETFLGSGGELNQCSTSFCSKQSAGETAVGNTSSTNFQSQAGFNTTDAELLEVSVDQNTVDLGLLTESTTGAGTATFSVRNYLSNGYVVRILGHAPRNVTLPGEPELFSLGTQTASSSGTEQFGINLVHNTTPGVGADPAQSPDSTFGFGYAAPGYDNPDEYKFVPNDIIAQSDSSSGKTDYTISFIANISDTTGGGEFLTSLYVAVIPTF